MQGVADRRVVQQRHPHVRLQRCHRRPEPAGDVDGVAGEDLHLWFTEHAGIFAGEPAAEALDTRDTEDLTDSHSNTVIPRDRSTSVTSATALP
jgi:hypothetical protein